MILTEQQIKSCLPRNKQPAALAEALNKVLPIYEIDTVERVAAFLAQCGHESNDFTALKENLNYSAKGLQTIFPRYFPGDLADDYARQPQKIANRVYGNRMGNGDEESGDGWKYRGRGAIQLTGKNNYTKFAETLMLSMDETIAYLETLAGAVEGACWYWKANNLNRFSDKGDVKGLTRAINGGYIGLSEREEKYNHCVKCLKGV